MSTTQEAITALTAEVANNTTASQELAAEVTGKMGAIDSKVSAAETQLNSFQDDIKNIIPLPPNLFSNSLMRSVEPEGHPTGYTYLNCHIEAVHPYTQGFEGPYLEERPDNAVDSVDQATKDNPYWFGRYNKGARIKRGGLAGGWGGISSGNILKASTTKDQGVGESKLFRVPVTSFGLFHSVVVQFWVKVTKGAVGVGQDCGYFSQSYNDNRFVNGIWDTNTGQYEDGWKFFKERVSTSQVVSLTGNALNFGFPSGTDCEVYIALPYIYNPMGIDSMNVAIGETAANPVFTPGE